MKAVLVLICLGVAYWAAPRIYAVVLGFHSARVAHCNRPSCDPRTVDFFALVPEEMRAIVAEGREKGLPSCPKLRRLYLDAPKVRVPLPPYDLLWPLYLRWYAWNYRFTLYAVDRLTKPWTRSW